MESNQREREMESADAKLFSRRFLDACLDVAGCRYGRLEFRLEWVVVWFIQCGSWIFSSILISIERKKGGKHLISPPNSSQSTKICVNLQFRSKLWWQTTVKSCYVRSLSRDFYCVVIRRWQLLPEKPRHHSVCKSHNTQQNTIKLTAFVLRLVWHPERHVWRPHCAISQ